MSPEPVRNHFVHRTAAERYQRHRPYFHPRIIELVRARLALAQPLPRALDVGCGTGQSAVALRAIAAEVTATDISEAMLASAPAADGIRYVCAPAEQLPFAAASFPLVTVSMAFHWFDRPRFLAEAARVLEPGGWLILYGYHFTKLMAGVPAFTAWIEGAYQARFPLTPRHGEPVSEADLAPHGLVLTDRSDFTDYRPYSAEAYADSMLTHSNVIARIESGAESLESARAWLRAGLAPFFDGVASRDFGFAGWISWVRKPAG